MRGWLYGIVLFSDAQDWFEFMVFFMVFCCCFGMPWMVHFNDVIWQNLVVL